MIAVVATGSLSSVASAQVFKGFTRVDDVCPTCTTGPVADVIHLRSGELLRARVLVENETFFVFEKFGEWRAVGKDQVTSIERNAGVTRPTGYADQILLKDGIVLAGTISSPVSNTADAFDLNIPGAAGGPQRHVARSTVASVYQAGKRVYAADK